MRLFITNKITASMITVNAESDAFPKENLISSALIEKTRYTDNIVIDFTTATSITGIGIIGHSVDLTVQANATDSWGAPSFTTSFLTTDIVKFISESYRFWRILIPGSGGTDFINYLYLGAYLQMPGVEQGSTPTPLNTDVISTSQSGQKYTTPGVLLKNQTFVFPATTQTEYDNFKDWWDSDGRSDNIILVQFEEDLSLFPPFYCKVIEYGVEDRDELAYNWSISVEEAK